MSQNCHKGVKPFFCGRKMKPIDISDLKVGPGVRALNPDLFPDDAPLVAACGSNSPEPEKPTKFDKKMEKELQTISEQWLHHRGYVRLSAKNVQDTLPTLPRGWFGHLQKPIGNPLFPDLLIFDAKMDRCLMIELKVRDSFQPGQREMIDAGVWVLCWKFAEVEAVVTEWEVA